MENYNKSFGQDKRDERWSENVKKHQSKDSKVFMGLIFVVVGVLLIANNMGILPDGFTRIFISWPMLLIAIGVLNLARKAVTPGLILITIGSYFLAPRIFDLPYNFFSNFWPVFLIAVGLIFIFKWKKHPDYPFHTEESNADFIDETAIFGGRDVNVVSENFRGGDVTSLFGGSKINLMHAKPTENCTIDVTSIFGGSKLIVPENWNVKVETTSIFGGFNDKRNASVLSRVDRSKVVIIKGVAIFGGGEITTMP